MAKETRQVKKAQAKRILFVEDDPVVVAVYRSRLENEGFTVDVVEDGAAATQYLSSEKPDLVILDLMLPKVNGLDVLKFIRSKPQLSTIPVIVLSNAYLADMVKKAMLAGANKPLFKTQCTPAMLVEVVKSFLPQQGEGIRPSRPPEEVERESITQARDEFLSRLAEEVDQVRRLAISYIKSANQPAGAVTLSELYQRVHFITARAALTGFSRLAILSSAFEALLFELVFKPGTVTASVLQTIAQTADCLKRLVERIDEDSPTAGLQAKVLVVDDDAVCNHVMVTALQRANLEAVGVKDPRQALDLLTRESFDLILLDIRMPGMDGFDVCKRIRQLAHQKTTPVVFVTANADFENRVQSVLSGGNEFIAKPVSPMELALKAITLLLDSKLKASKVKEEQVAQDSHKGVLTETAAEEAMGREEPEEVTESAQVEDAQPAVEEAPLAVSTKSQSKMGPIPAPGLTGRVESYAKGMTSAVRGGVEMQAKAQKVGQPPGFQTTGTEKAIPFAPSDQVSVPDVMPNEETPAVEEIESELPEVEQENKAELVSEVPIGSEAIEEAGQIGSEYNGVEEVGPELAIPKNYGGYGSALGDKSPGWAQESVESFAASRDFNNFGHMQPAQGNMQPMQQKPIGTGPAQPQPRLDRSFQADGNETFERIVRGVAEIIFGEENLTDINIRLVRFALERYGIKELVRQMRTPQM